VLGTEAGMHLVVTLPERFRDQELAARAAREKLWLWPLSPCYLSGAPRQGLILGFGSTPITEIPRAVRRLHNLLELK
jgi:GntR family transcriptional regulator/MocR family aminotransferase